MTVRFYQSLSAWFVLCFVASIAQGAPVAAPDASAAAARAGVASPLKGASVGQEQQDAGRRVREPKEARSKRPVMAPKLVAPPLPPAPPAQVQSGAQWLYEVRFSAPSNCTAFLEALRANLPALAVKKTPASTVKFDPGKPQPDGFADLLSRGRTFIDHDTLVVRDVYRNGRAVESASIRGVITNLIGRAVADGFYLTTLVEEHRVITNGVIGVRLDPGRIGKVKIGFKDQAKAAAAQAGKTTSPALANGRYFTGAQIAQRFEALEPGASFDYGLLYDGVYSANAHPDLVVNADLKVRPEVADGLRWRYVDMDLEVEESLPVHAVIDFSNYGTDASDNWETGLTLQHLNLTKHDDVLTVNAQTALDASLYSVAGSYYLPHRQQKGGGATLYGGYSDLSVDDVVPAIDVEGQGWFVGLQYSATMIDNDFHRLTLAVGKVHRYIEDQLVVENVPTEARGVDVAPFSLSAIYNTKPLPNWSGRFYATLELLYNIGDFLGSSDDEEIQRLRREASADYFMVRPQLALVQPFGGRDSGAKGGEGQWMFFFRAAGQIADGPLVQAEQIGVGGANTVRGYVEREFLGDHGAFANIELRTPMLLGFLTKPFASDAHLKAHRRNPLDRLQFVVFCDVGTIMIEDALPGEDDNRTLYSVGTGFRIAFTEYAQLKFDWGFPLEETDESSSSGTGHVNLQIQF
jgi:hemolysin activation/secretion protein